MAVEHKILEYLKKESPINTFRLARKLNLDRYKLLNLIKRLEDKGAVEVQHGVVKFLKFVEEKKEVKKTISKPKKKVIKKRKKIKKKPAVLKIFQAENQELKEKILQLETKLKKLEQKPVPAPKIIKKIIIKKVPTPKIIKKIIIKRIPIPTLLPRKKKKKAKKKVSQKKLKTKKFKFPKFKFTKYIKKLKKPKFVKGGKK